MQAALLCQLVYEEGELHGEQWMTVRAPPPLHLVGLLLLLFLPIQLLQVGLLGWQSLAELDALL